MNNTIHQEKGCRKIPGDSEELPYRELNTQDQFSLLALNPIDLVKYLPAVRINGQRMLIEGFCHREITLFVEVIPICFQNAGDPGTTIWSRSGHIQLIQVVQHSGILVLRIMKLDSLQ